MREILFRGKTFEGEWVKGNLVHQTLYYGYPYENYHIVGVGEFDGDYYDSDMVDRNTIGQYTGMKDKNGKKIFEGDILRYDDPYTIDIDTWEVYYDEEDFTFSIKNTTCEDYDCLFRLFPSFVEVIGNIHDNPELLEVKE